MRIWLPAAKRFMIHVGAEVAARQCDAMKLDSATCIRPSRSVRS
jgi:hypothetical protein